MKNQQTVDNLLRHFEKLPKKVRLRATRNLVMQSDCMLASRNTDTLREAIRLAFIWVATPEGCDYWSEVYNSIGTTYTWHKTSEGGIRWEKEAEKLIRS